MPVTTHGRARTGRTLAVLAGSFVVVAIILLSVNVSRELRKLGSASSENGQWSLAQMHVEYLHFSNALAATPDDLQNLRRRYDIMYSRIGLVSEALVFDALRRDPDFAGHVAALLDFRAATVPIVDGPDAELRAAVPRLRQMTEALHEDVRGLTNVGINLFARNSDNQRRAVAETMLLLAIALAALIAALGALVFFLSRMYLEATRRERLQIQTATRLNTVIGTSLDGVIVADSDGRIIEFSAAAEVIFGHRRGDVLGQQIGEVLVPDDLVASHEAGMERMRTGGEPVVVGKGRRRFEAKHASGAVFPIELAVQSATTDEGRIYVAFLRDISDNIAAEKELVAARDRALAGEKVKSDFLATMSHEIRTPLNGLLGNMDLLRDTSLTADQARYVRNMDTSGRLLLSHISNVLDITRYDAGKLRVSADPVDIDALLQDIVDSQSGTALAHRNALTWGWDGPPQQWVQTDPARLQDVLLNLVGNAVKFTRDGSVSLRARFLPHDSRPQLRFEIRDTGPGIAAELAGRIFDDFVTGNTVYDRESGGTGLGLSIARRFVSALDGEIGFDSTPGAGSTFWVRIPAPPISAPDVAQAAAQPQVAPGLRVLVVEDNEINRAVAREMLESDGHRVTEAHDGKQGVETALAQRFDLILMDISMPVMDGRHAIRAIRAAESGTGSARTPIYALTASAMASEQRDFRADGVDGILIKPLSRQAMRRALFASKARPALVDHVHGAESRAVLGEAAHAVFLARFGTEVEELLQMLNADPAPGLGQIAARAHKIAGSAAVFGATGLREGLHRLVAAAEAGDTAQVQAQVAALAPVWAQTRAELAAAPPA